MVQSRGGSARPWKPRHRARSQAPTSAAELEEARVRYLGRKSELAQALRAVRGPRDGHDAERRPRPPRGRARGPARTELERAELDRALTEDVVDVTLPGDPLPLGHLHPITQARRQIEDAFLGLGYEIRDDREVETTEYNFDKLAFDPWHPARSPRATFFFDDHRLLRTETSPSQIHALEEHEPPIYMVSIGRCYRRDAIDADALPDLPPVRGSRRRPRAHARRPEGHAPARDARDLRARPARPLPHALLPVHGALDGAGRLLRDLRRRGLPNLPLLRLDRDGRLGVVDPQCSRTSASTPRSGAASPSAAGSSASRS